MRFFLSVVMMMWPVMGVAELGSLLGGGAFGQGREAMLAMQDNGVDTSGRPSLFAGQQKGSFFAPYSARVVTARIPQAVPLHIGQTAVVRLRHVIGCAESPQRGYDAVQHGARVKPRKRPTDMTIGEIYDWIAATPSQPHAIGRYQFIPATLRRVAKKVGAKRGDRFTPALQDRLADVLLADAGFAAFMAGRLAPQKFMKNLAGIWAGLPTSTGRSKYHGYAGNRATITLAYFQSEIAKISPG